MLGHPANIGNFGRIFRLLLALALIAGVSYSAASSAGFPAVHSMRAAIKTSRAVSRLQPTGISVEDASRARARVRHRLNVAAQRPLPGSGAGGPTDRPSQPAPAPVTDQPTAIDVAAGSPQAPPNLPPGEGHKGSTPPLPSSPNPPPEPPAPTPSPEPPAPSPVPSTPEPPAPIPSAPEPPAPVPSTPEPPPPSEPEPPAPTPPPEPPAPNGEVLFSSTFDSFAGWYVQSLPGRASIVSSNPFEGSSAGRFEVRDGDVEPDTGAERSEVSGATFNEGEDLFVRDAIRVPAATTYQGPWQIIEQLHEDDWGGSPGVAVFLDSQPSLRIGGGDGSPTFWIGPQLEKDRWYELVYRVNLSQSSSTGFVEVWLDGVQQKLSNGQTRVYGQTIQTATTYLKAGIYRAMASTGTSIVEHDSIAVGTSYASVVG